MFAPKDRRDYRKSNSKSDHATQKSLSNAKSGKGGRGVVDHNAERKKSVGVFTKGFKEQNAFVFICEETSTGENVFHDQPFLGEKKKTRAQKLTTRNRET